MKTIRPFTRAIDRLSDAGLRPTRQRVALARLLFEDGDRHISAEQLHREATEAGVKVSLATVYNSLNQFTIAGLLREVAVEAGRSYFDTNTTQHHHFFNDDTGELQDIPGDSVVLSALPAAPENTVIDGVDVIVHIRNK
ncbi:MAG: transcriptional repressor [Alphaproteobacteria bacterium]|nr:transcriptional repressor [Alphaproteobacteria bacterium]